MQMNEIKTGLRLNLDVSVYAKSEINAYQMKEIRERLLKEKRLRIF